MGREMASAIGRWCALTDAPVQLELTAICDLNEPVREWFRRIPSVQLFTADSSELCASPNVDVVYVAVPHHLHESLYLAVLPEWQRPLRGKAFGIDLAAARRIRDTARELGRFVRCSSEFPSCPECKRPSAICGADNSGRRIEIRSGFTTRADLDLPSRSIGNARTDSAARSA